MIAVDTNVLVGAVQTFDPQVRATARRAVKALFHQDEELRPRQMDSVCTHHMNLLTKPTP
jgi:hypothetical protein